MTATSTLPHDWWPRPIPSNVTIGERTWLHSAFAFVHCASTAATAVSIGNDCGVYINTIFDLGPDGEVRIGDYCTIVGLIVATNGKVVIDDYSFIAHDVLIADSAIGVPPRSRGVIERDPRVKPAEGSIAIGENVWVGARCVMLPGTNIGAGAVVGAATVVDFEVPPGAVVAGNPARIVGSVGGDQAGRVGGERAKEER